MSDRIVPLAEALNRLGGISRSTFYRGVAAGEFPPLTLITKRRGGLLESQILDLIQRATTARDVSKAARP